MTKRQERYTLIYAVAATGPTFVHPHQSGQQDYLRRQRHHFLRCNLRQRYLWRGRSHPTSEKSIEIRKRFMWHTATWFTVDLGVSA